MSLVTDYVIKTGDRAPNITATCKDGSGNVVDLTGATARFVMINNETGVVKVAAAATISNPTGGVVTYAWEATDTDTAGLYDGEFEVTFSGGIVQTFPNDRQIVILITPDLD